MPPACRSISATSRFFFERIHLDKAADRLSIGCK
jgi:hypothetical protein